jgi:hypothetical protein
VISRRGKRIIFNQYREGFAHPAFGQRFVGKEIDVNVVGSSTIPSQRPLDNLPLIKLRSGTAPLADYCLQIEALKRSAGPTDIAYFGTECDVLPEILR